MGNVSKDELFEKPLIWICELNPITLPLTSCLNPTTIATDIIIIANPKATPKVAIRIAGGETFFLPSLLKCIFFAINSSKFI